jgi:hypothetical protein
MLPYMKQDFCQCGKRFMRKVDNPGLAGWALHCLSTSLFSFETQGGKKSGKEL